MTRESLERALGQVVLNQGPNAIVVYDLRERIRYVNARFTAIAGFAAEQVIGQPLSSIVVDTPEGRSLRELRRRVTAGREWRGELCARRIGGEAYWEFASVTPVRGADRRIILFLKVSEDVTDRKRA
jgi:two-component system CheB/CheR fusion protein